MHKLPVKWTILLRDESSIEPQGNSNLLLAREQYGMDNDKFLTIINLNLF